MNRSDLAPHRVDLSQTIEIQSGMTSKDKESIATYNRLVSGCTDFRDVNIHQTIEIPLCLTLEDKEKIAAYNQRVNNLRNDRIRNLEFKIQFSLTNIRHLLGEANSQTLIDWHKSEIAKAQQELDTFY